jgi:oxygen-independent coproporphyrinogen-3 oxidase
VGFESTVVTEQQAIEESYFLGLRLNRGVCLQAIQEQFGPAAVDVYRDDIAALIAGELLLLEDGWLRLTPQGRLLSNDVFAAFLRD